MKDPIHIPIDMLGDFLKVVTSPMLGDWSGWMMDDPVKTNKCGACTACCTALAIFDYPGGVKPMMQRCPDLIQIGFRTSAAEPNRSVGCAVYEDRPKSCREFECCWVNGIMGGRQDLRPDRIGIVLHVDSETPIGTALAVVEAWAGAAESPRAKEIIETIAGRQPVFLFQYGKALEPDLLYPEELKPEIDRLLADGTLIAADPK
jgi:Fe-S-cluster containining protein